MLRFVKIYGERNSGTTYLAELIEANFRSELLAGVKRTPTAVLRRAVAAYPEPLRAAKLESLIDADIAETLQHNFGWKHSAPPLDIIRRQSHRAGQALFIVVVRHPYSWVESMYRNPYHDLLPRSQSVSAFLRREWKLVERDNLGHQTLANPLDLWNRKMAAFFALDDLPLMVLRLRHEEFFEDFDTAMGRLAAHLPRRSTGPWVQIESGTKDPTQSYRAYAAKARAEQPGAGLGPDDLAFINKHIDRDLVAKLGYELRG